MGRRTGKIKRTKPCCPVENCRDFSRELRVTSANLLMIKTTLPNYPSSGASKSSPVAERVVTVAPVELQFCKNRLEGLHSDCNEL